MSTLSNEELSDAFDYPTALKKRNALQVEMDNAYSLAFTLQDKFNLIDQRIVSYEREQAALDD